MRWIWGASAVAALAAVVTLSPRIHLGILAYHAVCAAGIVVHRRALPPLFARGATAWTLAVTLVFLAGLGVALLVVPTERYRDEALRLLFPWEDRETAFLLFAAYSLLVHVPLEEVFWRGVFSGRGGTTAVVAGNALAFYAVHAAPLGLVLGPEGVLLALPTALAGAAWAFVVRRTGSLGPAVVSHGIVDLAILSWAWAVVLP